MNFTHNEKSTGKNFTGITIVILLHIVVAYGIVSGLGKRLVSKMAEPVETKIIEEEGGQKVTLIAVPSFRQTGLIALLDMETLEVESMKISL